MHCQHTIFLFKVPVGVLKRLEAIRSKFFRGVDVDSRKIAWFSWDKVIASKEVGGLGMSSFYAMIVPFFLNGFGGLKLKPMFCGYWL